MVRPTSTRDVPSCNNRFAALDENYSESLNRRTLSAGNNTQGKPPPLPRTGQDNSIPGSTETADETSADYDGKKTRWLEPRVTHTQVLHGKLKEIRDRSASTKRKGCDNNENPSKAARLESTECPHLKVIDQNKSIFKKVLDSLSDYAGENPVLCDAIRDLSIGMNGINDILGVLMAERLIPGESPEIIVSTNSDSSQGATCLPPTKFPFNSGKDVNNSRRHLNQAPLGDHNSWATVAGRKQQRTGRDQSNGQHGRGRSASQHHHPGHGNERVSQDNTFNKAVKDAERSILVFNLNLGSTPIMNFNTISSKVTVSLLNLMKEKEKTAVPTQEAKDFIDDILSQVVKMDFYGTKTSPCKFQGNSEKNGTFYTVPVKMMFKDRKGAQTASELLRECIGLSSTTPYHRSLRAAISLAVKLVKEENPGYQAKTNLDLNGKTLKCFIRTDTNPPGNWVPYGKNIPLPEQALDPSIRNFSDMCLRSPSSPSLRDSRKKTKATDNRLNRNSAGFMDCETGNEGSNSEAASLAAADAAKQPPVVTLSKKPVQSEEELMQQLKEVNRVSSPLPEFMQTPKQKGNGKRNSLLVQHSPPLTNLSSMSSFGS
jgi:hypothetical protein